MYVVLTKNSNDTWDVISQVTLNEGTLSKTVLENAFQRDLPIVGMDATAHTTTAMKGSTWDGTSFSGGVPPVGAPEIPEDFFTLNKRYVFLCDNKVVLSMTVPIGSPKADMWSAAMAGETIIGKSETGPRVKVGKTFNWDGTELTLVVPE
jgi:hypothetical protein